MDCPLKDEDIFYSDDEDSDSEGGFPQVAAYKYREPSSLGYPYSSYPSYSSLPTSNTPSSCGSSPLLGGLGTMERTIDRPVSQVCSGLRGLGLGQARTWPPQTPTSYSTMAKKEPLQSQKPNIIRAKLPPNIYKTEARKGPQQQCVKVQETALMAGYRFRASAPEHDPRYPCDQQLMVGPIPGHLGHDTVYNGLRALLQARGPVCFMFLHKSAVRDNDSGKPVKFGYVVFAEKGAAQKVLNQGEIAFNGGIKIKVSPMV